MSETNSDTLLEKGAESTTLQSPSDSNNLDDFSLDDIFINLTLISRIEVGNKLIIKNKRVNIDVSYFPFLTRWFYGQNHSDALIFINNILLKSFVFNDLLIKDKTEEARHNLLRLHNILMNVVTGLTNLMQTYYYDKLTQSNIEVMINTIRSKLNMHIKYIHYIYNDVQNVKNYDNTDTDIDNNPSCLKSRVVGPNYFNNVDKDNFEAKDSDKVNNNMNDSDKVNNDVNNSGMNEYIDNIASLPSNMSDNPFFYSHNFLFKKKRLLNKF